MSKCPVNHSFSMVKRSFPGDMQVDEESGCLFQAEIRTQIADSVFHVDNH